MSDWGKIILQICEGLSAIHREGIVHQDLKPANIILLPNKSIKIADFGIAYTRGVEKLLGNEVVGSAAYIAPETWSGRKVTPAADMYSLGVCLYELLTGKLPFDGESALEVSRKHLHEAPVPPKVLNPDIPQWLSSIILRMLEKSPVERISSPDSAIYYLLEAEPELSQFLTEGTEDQPDLPRLPQQTTPEKLRHLITRVGLNHKIFCTPALGFSLLIASLYMVITSLVRTGFEALTGQEKIAALTALNSDLTVSDVFRTGIPLSLLFILSCGTLPLLASCLSLRLSNAISATLHALWFIVLLALVSLTINLVPVMKNTGVPVSELVKAAESARVQISSAVLLSPITINANIPNLPGSDNKESIDTQSSATAQSEPSIISLLQPSAAHAILFLWVFSLMYIIRLALRTVYFRARNLFITLLTGLLALFFVESFVLEIIMRENFKAIAEFYLGGGMMRMPLSGIIPGIVNWGFIIATILGAVTTDRRYRQL
ncbi:MAG: serine/threonine-protein kinase, partial [bacterium]|nr:serine/threonine-protein kinase [bacterium]